MAQRDATEASAEMKVPPEAALQTTPEGWLWKMERSPAATG